MKLSNILKNKVQITNRNEYLCTEEFREDLLQENLHRGALLTLVTIAFELVFLTVDIISWLLKVNTAFAYFSYLSMYAILIALNLVYLLFIHFFACKRFTSRTMFAVMITYITLMMTWGSVISLLDQKLYAQLMGFMINMAVSSFLYLLNAKRMLIPFVISTLVLIIGLPFFQPSGNVLFGHYINLLVFIVLFWFASRIAYRNYCDHYVIRKRMSLSESLLEKEMEEKRVINEKLASANAQLKQLALLDELTGLPNRRSFREFVGKLLQSNKNAGLTASVIMIDIDFFKQYNDFYGHETGDLALIQVAKEIGTMAEGSEQIAVRWGGEEFIYFAFHQTLEDTLEKANVLRLRIAALKIANPRSSICPYITVSLGACAGNVANKEDIFGLLKLADQSMYRAKNSGRNCVVTPENTAQ